MPRGTHPPLKSYGLKRACIGPRASWAASCSSCLGTEAIRRGLKAAAAIWVGAGGGLLRGVVLSAPKILIERPGGFANNGRTRRSGARDAVAQSTRKSNETITATFVIEVNESSQVYT